MAMKFLRGNSPWGGEGKKEAEDLTDEDIEKNINQMEFDNEFCSVYEKRFGVLESVYA